MAQKRLLTNGRRRPKRQRIKTTLYSDDNPSTFTTKKKKKKGGDDDSAADEPEEVPPRRTLKRSEAPSKPVGRKPYNKRGRKPKSYYEALAKENAAKASAAAAATASSSQEAKETAPSKQENVYRKPYNRRKRKRPPSTSLDVSSPEPAEPTTDANTSPSVSPTRQAAPPPSPPLPIDSVGTLLPHTVSMVPVVPPVFRKEDARNKNALKQQFPTIFGKGLGLPAPLNTPRWSPLHTPDVYFDQDYNFVDDDSIEQDNDKHDPRRRSTRRTGRLDPNLLPVTRSVTCMTTRRPDHQYMAVGDSAGFCIIYSLGPHIRAVARLESQACQQRAFAQQQSVRQQRSKRKKIRSLVVDTSQTTILALGMVGSRIVLATACELECIDIPTQSSLWVCPLSKERIVTYLDVHPSTFDVLVSCRLPSFYQNENESKPNSTAEPPVKSPVNTSSLGTMPTSPLMLLKHSPNNVEICDANSPILVKSPCCSAIWDSSRLGENRLLFVAPDENELELVLVQGGSIDNWKVACKTRIPVKASYYHTKLSQSPEGIYTMVASSRGIRLYLTETLQLLQVYGDLLALHGKSIVWKDCLLMGTRASHTQLQGDIGLARGSTNAVKTIEYEDALNVDSKKSNDAANVPSDSAESLSHTDLRQYIVGVPDPSKGPKELSETLHVWSVAQATTVPTLTIPLPGKSDGVQSLVLSASTTNLAADRLILATHSGQCHELLPQLQSDFAGIMYAPGYHVIRDNLEYIEDEDELDEVEPARSEDEEDDYHSGHARHAKIIADELNLDDDDDDESSNIDDDLREALRRSLLEQKQHPEQNADDDVVVVDESDSEYHSRPAILPCRPEEYLRERVFRDDDSASGQQQEEQHHSQNQYREDEVEVNFLSEILGAIPNASRLVQKRQKELQKRRANGGKQPLSEASTSSATTTQNQNGSNGVIMAKPGRGKRSRATNLDAMLKASINSKLQAMMMSKQFRWSDGSGSLLKQEKEESKRRKISLETKNSEALKEASEKDAAVPSSNSKLPTGWENKTGDVSDNTRRNSCKNSGEQNGEAFNVRQKDSDEMGVIADISGSEKDADTNAVAQTITTKRTGPMSVAVVSDSTTDSGDSKFNCVENTAASQPISSDVGNSGLATVASSIQPTQNVGGGQEQEGESNAMKLSSKIIPLVSETAENANSIHIAQSEFPGNRNYATNTTSGVEKTVDSNPNKQEVDASKLQSNEYPPVAHQSEIVEIQVEVTSCKKTSEVIVTEEKEKMERLKAERGSNAEATSQVQNNDLDVESNIACQTALAPIGQDGSHHAHPITSSVEVRNGQSVRQADTSAAADTSISVEVSNICQAGETVSSSSQVAGVNVGAESESHVDLADIDRKSLVGNEAASSGTRTQQSAAQKEEAHSQSPTQYVEPVDRNSSSMPSHEIHVADEKKQNEPSPHPVEYKSLSETKLQSTSGSNLHCDSDRFIETRPVCKSTLTVSATAHSASEPRVFTEEQASSLLKSSLCSNLKPDEAAVALGLLGLSPCNVFAPKVPMKAGSMDIPTTAQNNVETFPPSATSMAHMSNITKKDCVTPGKESDAFSHSPVPPSENSMSFAGASADSESRIASERGSVSCETRSEQSATGQSVNPSFGLGGQNGLTNQEFFSGKANSDHSIQNIVCNACLGRMVVHVCGKRSRPIDFDEVARAERDKKEREEEEKKKARAEKRRLADAKRREVRKQKQREREEFKRQQEEKLKLEREEQKRQKEKLKHENERLRQLEANNSFDTTSHVYEESSREQAVYDYNPYTHVARQENTTEQIYATEVNNQLTLHTSTVQETAAPNVHWSEAARVPEKHVHSGYEDQPESVTNEDREVNYSHAWTSDSSGLKDTARASVATFASAEALATLAGIAEVSAQADASHHSKSVIPSYSEIQKFEQRQHYSYEQLSHGCTNVARETSKVAHVAHGFGECDHITYGTNPSSYEPKARSIPSYAAIGAQTQGDIGFNPFCGYEARAKSTLTNVMQSNGEQTYKPNNGWATFSTTVQVQGPEVAHVNYVEYPARTDLEGNDLQRNLPGDPQNSSIPDYHGSHRPY